MLDNLKYYCVAYWSDGSVASELHTFRAKKVNEWLDLAMAFLAEPFDPLESADIWVGRTMIRHYTKHGVQRAKAAPWN